MVTATHWCDGACAGGFGSPIGLAPDVGRGTETRADRVAPVDELAGGAADQPGLHHLSGGQAVPDRPAAETVGSRSSERTFSRCMGLTADEAGRTLWMSSLYQLWRFENALLPGQVPSTGHDRLYVPQVGYTTGDLDIHDLAIDRQGRPIFVNTLFSCLATTSETHSFAPLWQPTFISKLAAEDRCHLNGLAMSEGSPRYVTTVSESDVADGWRDARAMAAASSTCRPARSSCAGSRCPTRRACTRAGCGCSTQGQATSALSTSPPAASCPSPSARAMLAAWRWSATSPSSAAPGRARTKLLGASPWTRRWRSARPRRAAGCSSSTCARATSCIGCGSKGSSRSFTTSRSCQGVRRPMALGFKTDEIRRMLTVGEAPRDSWLVAEDLGPPAGKRAHA